MVLDAPYTEVNYMKIIFLYAYSVNDEINSCVCVWGWENKECEREKKQQLALLEGQSH